MQTANLADQKIQSAYDVSSLDQNLEITTLKFVITVYFQRGLRLLNTCDIFIVNTLIMLATEVLYFKTTQDT